ncbi:MAG: AAA family ATPase [Pseudomonadota bacterium]|nr:AAA family ATPase [Pseudomonadota bacterium]
MIIERRLDLQYLLQQKSHFLFGPRAVGKSTLISLQLADQAEVIDLLDPQVFLRISNNVNGLRGMITESKHDLVVIDEVQRLPALLNEVHMLIEREGRRFLLTGSSTRKLRRGGANMLAGRAWLAHLLPLTRGEINAFDLDRFLLYGGLPAVLFSKYPDKELAAYVLTYMREEVQAEGELRDLAPFSRFLRTMALANGEVINFSKLANDCQCPVRDVRSYVEILEDILLGSLLPPWTRSRKRKAVSTAKFYFFDTGVARTLAAIASLDRNSNLYGKAFEHFIWMELRAYLAYSERGLTTLSYWRSRYGHEVDFLVGEELAIEVKTTTAVSNRDLKGLQALAEEKVFAKLYLISNDPLPAKHGNIRCLPWQTFLDKLWAGELALLHK